MKVNDNVDGPGLPTDQFQPSIAAGPGGAVAVAFYDRRQACPKDATILAADRGRSNLCIDTSLQAYKDTGASAVLVGSNVRISQYAWDPEQPGVLPAAGAGDRALFKLRRRILSTANHKFDPSSLISLA